eukprot:TRINITY_DN57182_c0_g1_i1.p1 TRINITY_DN57182_c0_g1~~TRINITY_DN57182_c0_g1_i1.p1  ORF type:complete len:466 (+),score=37.07 TRINITY_DN57182_c0_g1_i1:185-1399(+)
MRDSMSSQGVFSSPIGVKTPSRNEQVCFSFGGRDNFGRWRAVQVGTKHLEDEVHELRPVRELADTSGKRPKVVAAVQNELSASNGEEEVHSHIQESVARKFEKYVDMYSQMSLERQDTWLELLRSRMDSSIESKDWTGVCRELCKGVAGLVPPRLLSSTDADGVCSTMDEDARDRLRRGIQRKLRALIARGLSLLDLSDSGTLDCLKPALEKLAHLVDCLERMCLTKSVQVRGGRSWQKIQDILAFHKDMGPADASKGNVANRNGRVPLRGRRAVQQGEYSPSESLQALPWVECRDEKVEFACAKCSQKIVSRWWFAYDGECAVMKPHNGHIKCGAPYVPVDRETKCKSDAANTFPCEHNYKQVKDCPTCGGSRAMRSKRQRVEPDSSKGDHLQSGRTRKHGVG